MSTSTPTSVAKVQNVDRPAELDYTLGCWQVETASSLPRCATFERPGSDVRRASTFSVTSRSAPARISVQVRYRSTAGDGRARSTSMPTSRDATCPSTRLVPADFRSGRPDPTPRPHSLLFVADLDQRDRRATRQFGSRSRRVNDLHQRCSRHPASGFVASASARLPVCLASCQLRTLAH